VCAKGSKKGKWTHEQTGTQEKYFERSKERDKRAPLKVKNNSQEKPDSEEEEGVKSLWKPEKKLPKYLDADLVDLKQDKKLKFVEGGKTRPKEDPRAKHRNVVETGWGQAHRLTSPTVTTNQQPKKVESMAARARSWGRSRGKKMENVGRCMGRAVAHNGWGEEDVGPGLILRTFLGPGEQGAQEGKPEN